MGRLKRKRHCGNNPEARKKRREPDRNERYKTVKPKAITIADINYDCLERIFDSLNLETLLKVADTCKTLQIAAVSKCKHFLNKRRIRLDPFGAVHTPPEIKSIMERGVGNVLIVSGWKLCLSFLRLFGASISFLTVAWKKGNVHQKNDFMNRYITKYCCNALFWTSFENCRQMVFEKPLESVETLNIIKCDLGNSLPKYVNWFPNLRNLNLDVCDQNTLFNMTFPHLQHLTIFVGYDSGRGILTTENASDLLHANRQLISLRIDTSPHMTFSTLMIMISGNPFLSSLRVDNWRSKVEKF